MRTRESTITFRKPFVLNRDVGELPAGPYHIEVDEEEIPATDRIGYRRTAIHLFVQAVASTRTIAATPTDLDSALERDDEAARAGVTNLARDA
jgi:hypothetical protein